jgi:hypothetical protein
MFLGGYSGLYVGLTTLSPSCPDCLEILEPHPTGTLKTCPMELLYLFSAGLLTQKLSISLEK